MIYKRIIYALLYCAGEFHLSRNFRLQKVGNVDWLKNNFGFGETCNFIDELIIINVTPNPTKSDFKKYFEDIKKLKEKIFVPITLGGGIRKLEHAKFFFANGADKILINYLAHQESKRCEKIANIYGEQSISVMVDYKKENNGDPNVPLRYKTKGGYLLGTWLSTQRQDYKKGTLALERIQRLEAIGIVWKVR